MRLSDHEPRGFFLCFFSTLCRPEELWEQKSVFFIERPQSTSTSHIIHLDGGFIVYVKAAAFKRKFILKNNLNLFLKVVSRHQKTKQLWKMSSSERKQTPSIPQILSISRGKQKPPPCTDTACKWGKDSFTVEKQCSTISWSTWECWVCVSARWCPCSWICPFCSPPVPLSSAPVG